MLTVLHASDLQCGRPFRPKAAEAFLRLAAEAEPDVVVVAGDLTQRAKRREFAVAASLLARLPDVPCVVTPGNHDVPLYRVWERLLVPHKNWKALISPNLNSMTRAEGATLVALDSSAPRRAIVNGRVDDVQIDFARRAFDVTPSSDLRILVVHHHFVPVPDGTDGRPLPRAAELLRAFEDMNVAFVLGGHVHQTHVSTSDALLGRRDGPGLPLITCGTTTSWRGRGPERRLNSLNLLRADQAQVEVTPHVLVEGGSAFEPREPIACPLPGRSSTPGAGTEGAR